MAGKKRKQNNIATSRDGGADKDVLDLELKPEDAVDCNRC